MVELKDAHTETPCLPGGLVPMEQWDIPEVSVHRSLKDGLEHILVQLRMVGGDEAFQSLDDLPALSERQRQRFAPEPDFSALAQALALQIDQNRAESSNPRDVAVLVAPPFSGIREALARWPLADVAAGAPGVGHAVIAPPQNLLMNEDEAALWWDSQDLTRPWVVPELADFWLRHMSGLALIRELFRRIAAGDAGQGVVGCSSWCWQFWASYISDLNLAPSTPAPLDGDLLGVWLAHLSQRHSHTQVTARMTHDGRYVLPLDEQVDGKKVKRSGLLRDLAATSRGNPGVALAIWRAALRAEPEVGTEAAEEESSGRDEHNGHKAPCCWVIPLGQLSLPTLPQSRERTVGFVLHALLLHDGLDETGLELVTGVSAHQLSHSLSRLARAEIIARREYSGHWHVTALGYPTTRRHLQSWGFPVDAF